MEFLHDPENWIRIALVVFLLILVVMKVPGNLWKGLGATGDSVRAELDEAVRIRQEATDLLNSIKAQRHAAEAKAREIITLAEEQAAQMAKDARAKLEESIARREELAERKIAQAESQAAADVKAAAADLAAQLTETILRERLAKASSDPLVDKAIAEIPGRLH